MGVDIQGRFGKLSSEFQGQRRKKKKLEPFDTALSCRFAL